MSKFRFRISVGSNPSFLPQLVLSNCIHVHVLWAHRCVNTQECGDRDRHTHVCVGMLMSYTCEYWNLGGLRASVSGSDLPALSPSGLSQKTGSPCRHCLSLLISVTKHCLKACPPPQPFEQTCRHLISPSLDPGSSGLATAAALTCVSLRSPVSHHLCPASRRPRNKGTRKMKQARARDGSSVDMKWPGVSH